MEISGSAAPEAWTLGKLCVGWDNDTKLLWECDLTFDKDAGEERYNMDCREEKDEQTCDAVISKYNNAQDYTPL